MVNGGNTVTITVGPFQQTQRRMLNTPTMGQLYFGIGHRGNLAAGVTPYLTALTPIMAGGRNERTLKFTVTVRYFTSQATSENVHLQFVDPTNHSNAPAGLIFTGQNSGVWWNEQGAPEDAPEGSRTFTIIAMYDGTTAVPTANINMGILVAGYAHGYYTERIAYSRLIPVRDGQENSDARVIHVHHYNFGAFRTFAGDVNNTNNVQEPDANRRPTPAEGRGLHYRMTSDTNPLGGGWAPMNTSLALAFSGTLDGRGHIIQGFTVNHTGFFGFVTGTIRNVGFLGTVNSDGHGNSGGIVGQLQGGTIENSFFRGDITATADGNVIGGIAGLVGTPEGNQGGTIRNSYFMGNVNSYGATVGGIAGASGPQSNIHNNFARGTVRGNGNVGGIIGEARATLQNNVATNMIITRNTGSDSTTFGRIWGSIAGVTPHNNYAGGSVTFQNIVAPTVGSAAGANGIPAGAYNTQAWWQASGHPNGPGFVFGEGLGQWRWSATLNRPWLGNTDPTSN